MSEPAMERWQPRVFTAESLLSPEERAERERKRGYQEGLSKGEAEAQQKLQLKLDQFDAILESMEKPLQNVDKNVSEHLLALVLSATKAVLKRELTTDDNAIRGSLQDALAALSKTSGDIEVVLHPQDESLVTGLLKDQRSEVTIIASPEMLRGGCVVRRDDSLVDASIEATCKTVFEQLANQTGKASESNEVETLDADRIQAIADRFQSSNSE